MTEYSIVKKLLIFHPQSTFTQNDWDNYLYDTGATRDSFLDMSPLTVSSGKLEDVYWHYSEWDIAGKDTDIDIDLWYVGWVDTLDFVFDNPYLLKLSSFEKAFRGPKAQCTVVVHEKAFTHVTYRIDKELSGVLTKSIPVLLEHIKNETYTEHSADVLGLSKDFISGE